MARRKSKTATIDPTEVESVTLGSGGRSITMSDEQFDALPEIVEKINAAPAATDAPCVMPTADELEELYRLYRARLTAQIEDNSAAATHKETKAALLAADMAIINYIGDLQQHSHDPQQRIDFTETPVEEPDRQIGP